MSALPNYIEPAHVALERDVEAEMDWLLRCMDRDLHDIREITETAHRLRFERWSTASSWTYAMEGIPYAAEWKGDAFRNALMAGDICEIGRLIRESVVREFALNCVEDAEKAWENGTCA